MGRLRLGILALFVLGATACTHLYTPEELEQNELAQDRDARAEEEYDEEELREVGGSNAELMREAGEEVVTDSDR